MADIQSHAGLVNGDTGAPILELLHDNGDGTFSRVIYIKGGTAGGPATIADGADVAQGAKADAAWDGAAASPTIMAVLKRAATLPPAYGAAAAASANFTRPADTTAYASGDLVANNVTNTSVVALSFTVARVALGSGSIRRLRLRKSGTSLTNASFRLHLYTAAPTPANGDNGAWSTDGVANYLGSLDVTMDKAFTDGASGNGIPSAGNEITFALASGQVVYGLLAATAAYTPISGEVFTATLEVLQN